MCELNAYVSEDGKESLYLESVESVRVEGEKIFLRNLFGEERLFDGALRELSLKRGKIILEKK